MSVPPRAHERLHQWLMEPCAPRIYMYIALFSTLTLVVNAIALWLT
jgi:hypothetical protein